MTRVALYDVDSAIPNLALMKLARHHKERGDEVGWFHPLWASTYDRIYASKVFDFSDGVLLDSECMEIGGTGWDLKSELPPEIERLQPDYSLYGYPHSIGFTMRGCRFACKFCVVPEKEGRPQPNNTIGEIWAQRDSDFIVLLDNDFFGNPEWGERIAEIREHDLRVNFSQGLNIRIITEGQAAALASVRFSNIHCTKKQVHFAWDRCRDARLIRRGFERCVAAGIRPAQMAFYVLIGFDTTHEENLERVTTLAEWGCDPYAMPYDRSDPYQKAFARWVNHKAIFKTVPWDDYRASIKGAHSERGDAAQRQGNLTLGGLTDA
jgi:hypothetical protein|tara:strand:+ start:72 stop:1037 length:966 start_codon:yes stop_codon:yes gene_type:complete